jgi:CDP-glucose 4,6-dehydratase
MKKKFWTNKKVLITGHTGFKGRWLSVLLEYLGADVYGVSIKSTQKKIYHSLINNNYYCDVCDYKKLNKIIKKIQPQIIFHFAAQSLVLTSYKQIVKTYETNFMGTINIIEISKKIKSVKTLLITTTDKVYKNNDKKIFFHENSELGGKDPYSASKAALEIAIQSFMNNKLTDDMRVVSVRAGNVIGGGDFGKDRLMTDLINHFLTQNNKKKLTIRNPESIRPWQYILDVVYSYILLTENLYHSKSFIGSYNFGPNSKLTKVKVKKFTNTFQSFFKNKKKILYKETKKINKKEEKTIFLKTNKVQKCLNFSYKIDTLQELLKRSVFVYKKIYISKFKNLKKIYLDEIKNFLTE